MHRFLPRSLCCIVVSCVLASSGALAAEAFPAHPARMIVPYPAGGPNDVLARMLGGKLGDY